jgi:mannose-1-phosphate guanylyltransferase
LRLTDVGSWSTIAEIAERDASANTTVGNAPGGDAEFRPHRGSARGRRVENLVIIATADASWSP